MAKQPKLKTLLEDIFNEQPQINKYEVVEGVRSYGIVGKHLYNNSNIMEIAKQLSHIAEQAHTHVLGETDDWFDQVSVNKNMQSLKKRVAEFKKTAQESHQLNQRLTGLYEDMGHILNRYYDISEGDESINEIGQAFGHLDNTGDDDLRVRPGNAMDAVSEDAVAYNGNLDNTGDDDLRTRPGVIPEDAGDMDNDGKSEPDDEEYKDNKDKAIKKAMSNEGVGGLAGIPALGQFVPTRYKKK